MSVVEELCKKVRARLIDDHCPFFAVSAWKLTLIESTRIKTCATDGTRLWVNPQFFEDLHPEERLFVYAHEILHDILQHPYRCEGRDMELWNIVCDYVVNAILIADKIGRPPKGILECPPRFIGKSAEHVYAVLEKEHDEKPPEAPEMDSDDTEDSSDKERSKDSSGGATKPSPEPKEYLDCPTGSFNPAPDIDSEPTDMTPGDWEVATEEALMVAAKDAGEDDSRGGSSSPNTDRAIAAARESRTGWIASLWRFAEKVMPSETTWSTPNRRMLAHGLYFPGVRKNNMPRLGMGVDTSGSVSDKYLEAVAHQISTINTQLRPKEIEVVYCNSVIQSTEIFTPAEEVILHAVGGGGTCDMDFWPIITYFNDKEEDKPAAVLVFTDLQGDVPPEPDYPVMWIVPEWSTAPDPAYGETIRISLHSS